VCQIGARGALAVLHSTSANIGRLLGIDDMKDPRVRLALAASMLGLVATTAAAPAHAAEPCALSHNNNPSLCELPLLRGGFESLDGWTTLKGTPSAHAVDGGSVLRLASSGSGVSQRIALPAGSLVDSQALPHVALRLKLRSRVPVPPLDGSLDPRPLPGPGRLKLALSLSDDVGGHVVSLGDTEVEAPDGRWTDVVLDASAQAYAASAYLNVSLFREDFQLSTEVEVDDVVVTLRAPD
jgi:hypothetical protein